MALYVFLRGVVRCVAIEDIGISSIVQDDTEQSYDVTQHGKKPQLQLFIAEHLEQVSIIQHYDINAHDYQLLGGIATSP